MASGTGNLPNPSMSFSPFAILTAEEMNNLVENIESLADGSGVGDASIKAANIDFTTFDLGGQLTIKVVSQSYTSSSMASWGSSYYSDIAFGNWPSAFSSLITAYGYSDNQQFSVAGPSGASKTAAGTVRITKPTNGTVTGNIYVVGIGLV